MKSALHIAALIVLIASCSSPKHAKSSQDLPPVWPDYAGVTVPASIAPLNFAPAEAGDRIFVNVLDQSGSCVMRAHGKDACFPMRKWHKLLRRSAGSAIQMEVSIKHKGEWTSYKPFEVMVSPDDIDFGLTYRLITPGYEAFGHMGIFQRELSTFKQTEIIDNRMFDSGCVNCHTASHNDPSSFSLHFRGEHSATLLRYKGQDELLNTKTDSTAGFFVYPNWHPSGRYVAYSVNTTRQEFYTAMTKRIEVYDEKSDVIVYDAQEHKVLISHLLDRPDMFETYPAFSADGKTLYFCRTEASDDMPADRHKMKYSLCSISFDPSTGSFGDEVTTLVDAAEYDFSIATPRPSYDGKHILFAAADFGTFHIWHKEADLWMYDIATGGCAPADALNSDDSDSFHNWSSNSAWVVFSSRRDDGLYTKLYIAHRSPDGSFGKPFLLPQRHPAKYYSETEFSYNTPDFTSSSVILSARELGKSLKSEHRIAVLPAVK